MALLYLIKMIKDHQVREHYDGYSRNLCNMHEGSSIHGNLSQYGTRQCHFLKELRS